MNSPMGRMVFLTRDWTPGCNPPVPGGCAWYRCCLPMQALAGYGVDTRMGLPVFNPDHGFGVEVGQGRAEVGFDVAVLKLLMDKPIPAMIRRAQLRGQKVIVDVDDHYDALHPDNIAAEGSSEEANRGHNREHYRRSIMAADAVTVTTPELLEHYSRLRDNVFMVRNGVLDNDFIRRPTHDGRHPTIGWVGGIPWRSGDLETLRSWLPDFLEEYDLGFHHAGHAEVVPGTDRPVKPIWELAGIPRDRVTTQPLVPMNQYRDLFTQFDIGLVPLLDIPFNRAKSTIKGQEYAAAGIPFVAQDLPEYVRLSEMGVGRVAHTADDWVAQLTGLLRLLTRISPGRYRFSKA